MERFRKFSLSLLGMVLLVVPLAVTAPFEALARSAGVENLAPRRPILVVDDPNGVVWTQYQGDGDDVVEPGETWNITVRLRNTGATLASKISSTLSMTGGQAIVQVGSSLYPNILVGGTATNITAFRLKILNTQPCDSSLGLRFVARYFKGNRTLTYDFAQAVGPASSDCTVYNNAPIAVDDAYATTLNTPLIVPAPGILANDADPDRDPLTAELVSNPLRGILTLSPNGSFAYTPAIGYSGDITFTYRANDGLALSNLATVTITMTGNQPPVLASLPDQTVDELAPLVITATATDPEAPPEFLTYSLGPDSPDGAAINPNTGVFSWTPTELQGPGVYTPTVVVTDSGTPSRSDSQSFRVTVDEVNAAPLIDPLPSFVVLPQATIAFTVTVTDPDYPPESFSFSLDPGAPDGASIDPDTGLFTWLPSLAQAGAVYSITVRVADDGIPPLEATRTFQITVTGKLFLPVVAN